ncbi:portal protein [Massilia sp. TSP1-1-2]|uniref:portal protein n=1 Tax=Massilia sp. TSP1-1-2 TaxID=2804649 RepID=UPI003CE87F3A
MTDTTAAEDGQLGAMAQAMLKAQSVSDREAEQREYEQAATEALMSEEPGAPAFRTLASLGSVWLAEFSQAEQDRRTTETRWLQDLRQYRGKYDPDVLANMDVNRSMAFVRKTRVKVKTVNSRVFDLLFPANADRNWSIEPTPVPTVAPELEEKITAELGKLLQRAPEPDEIKQAVKHMVDTAAKAMSKVIDDQLTESRYKKAARAVIHSGHLYGTGILKAPLIERKVRTRFVLRGGKWVSITESYVVPFVDSVPLWRFFPDMSATELENCRYVYERHVLSKAATLALAERKSFDSAKIREYVVTNPDGSQQRKYYEEELRQVGERSVMPVTDGQYEILERWGWVDAVQLAACGVTVPQERMHETFFANVWLLPNGEVVRASLQPINGVTWPYHLYYFDKDETSIFGEGLATIMRDDQTMINAGVRMILDNAALTAGPQLEVNMDLMAPSEKADRMHPFKIWARNGKEPSAQAIRVLDIPGKLEELYPIVEMFESNADEVTAVPRFMGGENPTQGAAGTASGLSMLMGNTSVVMKDLITGYDEGITSPFISALYCWNMQFNKDNAIKGDYNIKARGSASLVAKEIRAQQLDAFSAQTANPMDAPFIKREKLLRQRAEAHDLVDVVKTEEEVAAEQNNDMAKQQQQLAQQQQELDIKMRMATLDKLTAEVQKVLAEARVKTAEAVAKNVAAVYAATQASGVAATNATIAPGADEILKSSGWKDADAPAGMPQAPEGAVEAATPDNALPTPVPGAAPMPEQPSAAMPAMAGPEQGMQAGIETAGID